MIIYAHGGLANRLRVILSFRSVYGPIDVLWKTDTQVSGARFVDVFEPLKNVRFVYTTETFDTSTCHPCPEAKPGWQNSYRELTLLPAHRATLASLTANRPYSAVHIRRTDHVQLAKSYDKFTTDDQFVAWLRNAHSPIYLATDNGSTQAQFLAEIAETGKQVIVHGRIREHAEQDKHDHRNTGLADAAIDLFACAGAAWFMGSGASSFSDTATMLRKLGGWWS